MHILMSDLFKKRPRIHIYLRLEIRGVCGYFFLLYFETNLMIICICTSKIVKPAFKTGFLLLNNDLNFWGQNSKLILCSRKQMLNVGI